MIPKTFEDWKYCIVQNCKIPLTKEFAAQRLTILENKNHKETKRFKELYGKKYLQNIISWYRQI